ncbi:hypothetical protein [Curtobacterium sp. 9128]|uniref:hypothetical protein n=1 Tax=Curtobacterium sp. 9128 TaxID=1793722 RepID=UPI00119D6659|nr:hypothetical protein [Curtobacterium sp. 9128]
MPTASFVDRRHFWRDVGFCAVTVLGGAMLAVATVALGKLSDASVGWDSVAFVSVYAVPVGVVAAVVIAAIAVAVRNHGERNGAAHPVRRAASTAGLLALVATVLGGLFLTVADWMVVVVAAFAFAGVVAALAALVLRRPGARPWSQTRAADSAENDPSARAERRAP